FPAIPVKTPIHSFVATSVAIVDKPATHALSVLPVFPDNHCSAVLPVDNQYSPENSGRVQTGDWEFVFAEQDQVLHSSIAAASHRAVFALLAKRPRPYPG